MGLKNDLIGKRVSVDTAPIIYFIEEIELFYNKMESFFSRYERDKIHVIVSVLCLTEVLVQPLRKNNKLLTEQYQNILSTKTWIQLLHIDAEIALKAAELRAKYTGLKTPDALQIATAIITQSDYFLTNDIALKKVEEIEVITIQDLPS